MEFGLLLTGISALGSGIAAFIGIKSTLTKPKVSMFFSVGEGVGYSTLLSRKHFREELKAKNLADCWLQIEITIANQTKQDVSIEGLAIHAGKSPLPIKNLTFGGKVLPHRLLANQSDRWQVGIMELTQGLNLNPVDYDTWRNLRVFVKLGNGKTIRSRYGITKKSWRAVTTGWKNIKA